MKKWSVAVVIPCRNELRYIEACVRSVLMQDYPKELLRVYVVDGMSDDGTRELLQRQFKADARVHLIDNVKQTTPYALNLGIQAANADVTIIFGAHAEMHQYYVSRCVLKLAEDEAAGCVGGIIENVNENQTAGYISQCMSSSFGVGNAHFRTGNASGYVDTVAFGAYKSEVFEKIGFFDEALTRNQDDEFNYRVKKAGFEIVLHPAIRSSYFVRGSYAKLARQYFQYGYWKVYVNALHATITTWRQLIPFVFVTYLICALALTLLWPSFLLAWCTPFVLYLIMAAYISIRFDRLPLAVVSRIWVFMILHTSYGWGYFRGIVRFLVFRQSPENHSIKSSR